jgi:hypothetical protein
MITEIREYDTYCEYWGSARKGATICNKTMYKISHSSCVNSCRKHYKDRFKGLNDKTFRNESHCIDLDLV